MIKTFIVLGVLVSFIVIAIGFSDVITILLQIKGLMITYFALVLSRLAIFAIFAEVAHEVIVGFLKRL